MGRYESSVGLHVFQDRVFRGVFSGCPPYLKLVDLLVSEAPQSPKNGSVGLSVLEVELSTPLDKP